MAVICPGRVHMHGRVISLVQFTECLALTGWMSAQDYTLPPGEPATSGCPEGASQYSSTSMKTALARDCIEVTLVASLHLLDAYEFDRGVEGDGLPCISLQRERPPSPRRGWSRGQPHREP